jgi:hypothetical protein
MAFLEQRVLKHHLFLTQASLPRLAQQFGKDSEPYRHTLTKIKRLWAMLQMTRKKEEFFEAITQ